MWHRGIMGNSGGTALPPGVLLLLYKARSATRCAARVSPSGHAAATCATSAQTVGVTRPRGQGYGSTAQATGSTRPRHTTPSVNASQRPQRTLSSAIGASAPRHDEPEGHQRPHRRDELGPGPPAWRRRR